MSQFECPICKCPYVKNERKAFILQCGDSSCSKCIDFYKSAGKETFECQKCCHQTKSLNIENNALYQNSSNQNNSQPAPKPQNDEFEILIRKKNSSEKFPILVKKTMTVRELKNKIKREQNIDQNTYELAFKKPLKDLDHTLESYSITQTVTVTMLAEFFGGVKSINTLLLIISLIIKNY